MELIEQEITHSVSVLNQATHCSLRPCSLSSWAELDRMLHILRNIKDDFR